MYNTTQQGSFDGVLRGKIRDGKKTKTGNQVYTKEEENKIRKNIKWHALKR